MIEQLSEMLAHNPGGQPIIPVPILLAIPLACLVWMIVLIVKKRYKAALIAFLAALGSAVGGIYMILDAVELV